MIGKSNAGGGGAKVTIDGVKVKDDLSLISSNIENFMLGGSSSGWSKNFTPVKLAVLNDGIYLYRSYKYLYKIEDDTSGTKPVIVSSGSGNDSNVAVQHVNIVELNNEIHVIGGNDNAVHIKWNGNAWVTVSTPPYIAAGQACLVVLNGEIHLLGGGSYGTVNASKHYKWNGNAWTEVSTLPTGGLYDGCAVVLNNEIYIMQTDSDFKSMYKWNGSAWTKVSTLPYNGQGSVCAEVLDGKIHIMGAYKTYETSHYVWDGTSWEKIINLPTSSNYGDTVVYKGQINYVSSGAYSTQYTQHYIVGVQTYRKKS